MVKLPQYSEKEILSLLADPAKRRKAFEVIVSKYSQQLYWKIRTIVVSHDDADDVLQNTFLKAWASLDDFRNLSKISTWLYRIAINEALDMIRKRRRANDVSMDTVAGIAETLMADPYFDGDQTQALVQEAIAALPDVQRTVFTLRYYHNVKYSEMSQMLDTSEGALKASYHIAQKKVTEYVEKRHS
jgi:RNA polymerase sigma-70 factor (ECF subfamily)